MALHLAAVCQAPLSSAKYNALPYVDEAHEVTLSREAEDARLQLLQLISDHCLTEVFSLHLLHRHFDVPEGQVMVYVTVDGPDCPTYQIMGPQKPSGASSLRGRFFFAAPDGSMTAYEYSSDPQPDITQYRGFCSKFWGEVTRLGMQAVFALGVRPTSSLDDCTEIEIAEARATVFVQDLKLLDSYDTDWTASSTRWDEGLPLKQAQSGKKCKRSKAKHTAIGPDSWAKDGQGGDLLTVDGQCLREGCQAFNVLTNAMQFVSVISVI